MSGGGGKYATMAAPSGRGFGRYTSVVDRYTPGMVRYGLRSDRTTPSELETASAGCRTFLLSRLRAAEVLGRRRRDPSSGDALGGGGGGGGGPANQPPMPPPIGQYNNVNFAFEQIRTKLLDLIETDITVVRQLLNAGELLEEIKWQRNYGGGGGGGGGSTSVDMSLADIESVDLDLDPYMTYLASSNKRLEDDVINADDADDVFQNDDTGGSLTKTTCSVQSNELRLTLTRSGNGVKVNSSDSAGSSKPHLVPGGNSRSLNKMTKVEFQVSGLRERGNKSLPKSQNDFTTAKENHETVEMQQEITGTKDEEKTTQKSTAAPAFLRLVVQRNNESDRNGQQHPSRHEQPQHNNNNNNNNNSAQLPVGLLSEANRRLNGSNANLRTTLEDAKTHSPSASSSASHQLRPGISQSQIRRQIKTEESKRGEASLDDASTAPSVVITHL